MKRVRRRRLFSFYEEAVEASRFRETGNPGLERNATYSGNKGCIFAPLASASSPIGNISCFFIKVHYLNLEKCSKIFVHSLNLFPKRICEINRIKGTTTFRFFANHTDRKSLNQLNDFVTLTRSCN